MSNIYIKQRKIHFTTTYRASFCLAIAYLRKAFSSTRLTTPVLAILPLAVSLHAWGFSTDTDSQIGSSDVGGEKNLTVFGGLAVGGESSSANPGELHLVGTTSGPSKISHGTAGTNDNMLFVTVNKGFKFNSNTSGGGVDNTLMFITPNGNVGIGTTSPTKRLDVNGDIKTTGNAEIGGKITIKDGDADIGGNIWLQDDLEENYHGKINDVIYITRHVENADNTKVGIGLYKGSGNSWSQDTPEARLHVNSQSTSMPIAKFSNNSEDKVVIYSKAQAGTTQEIMKIEGNLNVTGRITALNLNSNHSRFHTTSDRRWKKDIKTLDNSLDKITALRGVSYQWRQNEFPDKNFSDGTQIGVIAQEMEAIFPELVSTNSEGYKSVAYSNLVAPLIEAVKVLEQQNKSQSDQIKILTKRLDALEGG
jgi:hypothetical protein